MFGAFKLGQELGVGVADDDTKQGLGNWQEEYNEAKERYAKDGLNTEILNIELGVCNAPPDFISNREEMIRKIVKNKATTYSGHIFKYIQTSMANVPYLLEVTQVQVEEEGK